MFTLAHIHVLILTRAHSYTTHTHICTHPHSYIHPHMLYTHTHTHTHKCRWTALKALATERRSTLKNALEKAKRFHDNWKQQVAWLADAERRAYVDWKPCGLPETCDADITKHEVCMCVCVFVD